MNAIVKLEKLSRTYRTEHVATRALDAIDLEITQGEYVAICGPSGCGKSTLLSVLGLLDQEFEGKYWLESQSLSGLSAQALTKLRNRRLGFVFQNFSLLSDLNVLDNVALPLRVRRELPVAQCREAAANCLAQVGMNHRSQHLPAQLSGGEQQRVAIARALVTQPALILADEPTGNLDSQNAENVMQLLDTVHASGTTIVLVTHEPRFAARAGRIIALRDGRIESQSAV